MPLPALVIPSPPRITPHPGVFDRLTPLPINRFTNKLAPNVPSNMPRNTSFCSFASFLIVLPITQVLQEI